MWWQALVAAFGLTFVAELGDKTQLIILTLSARHGFRQVFLGAAAAFALLNALAVSVGVILYEFVPDSVIKYTVSGIFILFGIFMLLPERGKEGGAGEGGSSDPEPGSGETGAKKGRGPILTAFLLVCPMELGDKTSLAVGAHREVFQSRVRLCRRDGGALGHLAHRRPHRRRGGKVHPPGMDAPHLRRHLHRLRGDQPLLVTLSPSLRLESQAQNEKAWLRFPLLQRRGKAAYPATPSLSFAASKALGGSRRRRLVANSWVPGLTHHDNRALSSRARLTTRDALHGRAEQGTAPGVSRARGSLDEPLPS